jgi:hypothetical protein
MDQYGGLPPGLEFAARIGPEVAGAPAVIYRLQPKDQVTLRAAVGSTDAPS